jgi:hypothetical protein
MAGISLFESTEVKEYCQQVEGEQWKDPKVDTTLIEKMSDEQIGQVSGLYEKSNPRCMSSCGR